MRTRLSAFILSVTLAPCALAMPQAQWEQWKADYDEAYHALFENGSAKGDAVFNVCNEYVSRLNINELTPTQIAYLNQRGLLDLRGPEGRQIELDDDALARLEQFTDDKTIEGAAALLVIASIRNGPDQSAQEQIELLRPALAHPAMVEAARTSDVLNPLTLISYWKDETTEELAPELLAFAKEFASSESIDPQAALAVDGCTRASSAPPAMSTRRN